MKKILLLLVLVSQIQMYSQKGSEVDVDDDLVIDESNFSEFKGNLFIKDNIIYFSATDCALISKGNIKLNFEEKYEKKIKKKISKNDNKLEQVSLVGLYKNESINVKKVKTSYKEPTKNSGAQNVDLYVNKVFETYKEMKANIDEANYLTVVSNEINDPDLGMVTSNVYYNSECKVLTQQEVLELRPKALSSLTKSLEYLTTLLAKQAELTLLSNNASTELANLTGLKVLIASKNYSYANLVSKSMYFDIPKLISNLNKTKSKLEQLKNE